MQRRLAQQFLGQCEAFQNQPPATTLTISILSPSVRFVAANCVRGTTWPFCSTKTGAPDILSLSSNSETVQIPGMFRFSPFKTRFIPPESQNPSLSRPARGREPEVHSPLPKVSGYLRSQIVLPPLYHYISHR